METARRAVEKGQLDKAIREYQKVVEEDPKDVRVWLKIGDLFAKKGAKPEATETYTKVARFYSEQGFYLKAVAVYKQILKLDPRLVEVNLKLAELYRQLGLLSDAMQHFEMVAAFFHREGKTREALATLRQLVELDPENVATRIKLAELYSKEGMVEDAVTEFAQACDFLRAHNRIDDFIKVAERLLWHKSENTPLNKELATLYLRRGDPRRALQKLQICFKADPRDVDTLALLAQAFQALEQRGKTVSVLKELARVLTEVGKRAQAGDVHRKILDLSPDDADSLAFLGQRRSSVADELVVDDDMMVEEPAAAVQEFQARPGMGNPTGSFPLVRQPTNDSLPAFNEATFSPPSRQPGSLNFYSPPRATSAAEVGYVATEVPPGPGDSGDFAADLDLAEESSYESSVRGEANADEIIKILTETDVYVKYGLHQKAIEHLRRVFDLDPDNMEARERLKDILLGQGRQREAISQLVHLATLIAPRDPERAERYLRDVIALEPDHSEAHSVAARYRLDLVGEAEVEIVDDGPLDFGPRDALDFARDQGADRGEGIGYAAGSPPGGGYYPNHPGGAAYPGYDGQRAPSSAPVGPQRAPLPRPSGSADDYEFELDLDSTVGDEDYLEPSTGSAPGEVTDSNIFALSDDDIILEDEGMTMEVPLEQVDAVESSVEIGETSDELDFEGVAIAHSPPLSGPIQLEADEYTPPEAGGRAASSPFADPRAASHSGQILARPDEVTIDSPIGLRAPSVAPDPVEVGGSNLEDDLDEADFFIAQGLFDEARDILDGLLVRYPNHPLVTSKLEDLAEMESAPAAEAPPPMAPPGVDLLHHHDPTATAKPSVMLEKPIDDEDADTHFDLGLAYKEMGLYDEAIKAFKKVITVAGRAVQCHLMLGLCYREQGSISEAISQFKAGLYVDPISTSEKYGLYYEIGTCYEQLDDPQEALYYYEMIVKKQPDYRDVSERVDRLHAQRAAAGL
jgi:tetratricopeptide (TPR) repeat protein